MLLIVLICTIATTTIATVIKASRPGESADAVTMRATRIQHRRWNAQRCNGTGTPAPPDAPPSGIASDLGAAPAPHACVPARTKARPLRSAALAASALLRGGPARPDAGSLDDRFHGVSAAAWTE